MRDLSVIIPARNEEWLNRTVADVLNHSERDTEVIVLCDGGWPPVALDTHPNVQVLYVPSSIGQRAATNIGVKLSTAKYVMKLDAHVSMSQGFDRVLIEAAEQLGPNVTQIPAQKHLHVYDQVCPECQHRADQGPHWAGTCPSCHRKVDVQRVIVWKPRSRPTTTAWRLDETLHFQYWRDGEKRQPKGENICDVMTSLGACFFMERAYYQQIGGLDEAHGSWGCYGQELALKTWLSGGRHVVNKGCFFAHFFRVGGIGFPYPITGAQQDKARNYARDIWFKNGWSQQIYPLSWILEKFKPLPDWHDAKGSARLAEIMAAGAAFTPRKKRRNAVGWDSSQVARVHADRAPSRPASGDGQVKQLAQGMPVGAVGASGLVGGGVIAAQDVLPDGDLAQVGRVATLPVGADVVDDKALGVKLSPERAIGPRAQDAVNPQLGTGRAPIGESHSRVAGGPTDVAGPIPTARRGVDRDLAEDASELLAVEASDREILRGSHSPASIAGVGSGPSVRSERSDGPSILPRKSSAGCVYYSDCLPDPAVLEPVRQSIAQSRLPIVAVTLKPIDWPAARNIVLDLERGHLAMFKQILAGLEALDTEFAFLVEHDVIYHSSHFDFRPPRPEVYYYNLNVWKVHGETGHAVTYETKQTSGLCANRQLLVEHYRKRIEMVEATGFSRKMGFEPGSHRRPERVDDFRSEAWRSAFPNVDVRHGRNLTASRWSQAEFRDQRNCRGWQEADEIPGWGVTAGRFSAWLSDTIAKLSDDRHRELEVQLAT